MKTYLAIAHKKDPNNNNIKEGAHDISLILELRGNTISFGWLNGIRRAGTTNICKTMREKKTTTKYIEMNFD